MDSLTYGLLGDTEAVDMRQAIPEARAEPHRHRLPDDTRRWMDETYATLRKCGCDGPLAASLARAIRLDEEARRARAD